MVWQDYVELALLTALLALSAKPLGIYMTKVFAREKTWLDPVFGPIERLLYRLAGITPEEDQSWNVYARDVLSFSLVTLIPTYIILRAQQYLPLNPQHLSGMSWHLALNTAISFVTNTNWQSYGGESTVSYLSQTVALASHNFFSAAVGIAIAVAVVRGIARRQARGIGNFWSDLVRANLYLLLPMCIILALFYISQGMIQTFSAYVEATTLEGGKQIIALGPVASQVAIKMLGTNGGGFFGANAAHPFENPTALSNFVQMFTIFLIPSALVYLLGREVGSTRHGWSVWMTMAVVFVFGVLVCAHFEYTGNPGFSHAGLASNVNLEGKETRFGVFDSALFTTITTDASCGANNAMHDSFTPLGGLVPFTNILLGEIIFGGVGSGLYGMIMFIILTVFIAGLMVGRTPEYRGKKIEGREVKFAMLAIIVMAVSILGLSAWAVLDARGIAGLGNPSTHGLSEIVYAFSSAAANNGSAFAGLTTNTAYYNVLLTLAMFFGRFFMAIPMLAVAGAMANKRYHPESSGTFPVYGPMFMVLLLGVIVIVGALTYFPVLSLGPIAEYFQMRAGQWF